MFNILQNAVQRYSFYFTPQNIFTTFAEIKCLVPRVRHIGDRIIGMIMKKHLRHLGICAICLGVALLAIGYCANLSFHNYTNLLSLILIIGGSVFHFYHIKKESRY